MSKKKFRKPANDKTQTPGQPINSTAVSDPSRDPRRETSGESPSISGPAMGPDPGFFVNAPVEASRARRAKPEYQAAWREERAESGPIPGDDDWVWKGAKMDADAAAKVAKQVMVHTPAFPQRKANLSEADVRGYLEEGIQFARGLVRATQGIMSQIPLDELRKICAGDIPCVGGVHFPKDKMPEREDPKKRPRGSMHPLMKLITLAVQADRMIPRFASMLFPDAFKSVKKKGSGSTSSSNSRAYAGYERAYEQGYARPDTS